MDKRINCEELIDLIGPYVDGELSASDREAIERHVAGCAGCASAVAETRTISATVRGLGRFSGPAGLDVRICHALDGVTERGLRPTVPPLSRRLLVASHFGAAVAGALAAVLWTAELPSPEPTDDVVAGHIRGLVNEQFRGVESGSPHTVRPWFAGKVEFAPRVPDVSQAGYPLLGGRVDVLQRRPVAALMYGRRDHRITLFVALNETRMPRAFTNGGDRGYHTVAWADATFAYWAVSDLNLRELQEFAALAQSAVATGSPAARP